jgi:hypothetical protein
MTEEAPEEQLFGQYGAAKKAVIASGLSEFEEEPGVATAPSRSAAWAANATVIHPSDVYLETVSQDYAYVVRATPGSGRTHIFLTDTGNLVKPFAISEGTLATSLGAVKLTSLGHRGSMATQQPPTTEGESGEEIIWRAATTLSVRYREKLTIRLSELQKAVQEEELECRGISVGSLHYFVEFLKRNPAIRCPAISVTPDRNIYASWKSGPDRVFSVHFLPDSKVRFVIFCPNDRHPGEAVRISGTATVDVLMSIAVPHGVLDWISDERPGSPRF